MNSIKLNREAKRKIESRKIVKEILDFGITESQKIDILYFLSLTIENNQSMKKITSFLQDFKTDINQEENNNTKVKSKLILK